MCNGSHRFSTAVLGLLAWTAAAGSAVTASAQVVQLPTIHTFITNTSVLVPDGGDVLLGGVNRASSGRIEHGIPGLPSRPFTNSAIGSSASASSVRVSAQIHDFEAMDRMLLGDQLAANSAAGTALSPAHQLAVQIGPQPIASVAALKGQIVAEDAARQKDAADELARGRQLLTEGKTSLAKTYCQLAARHAVGKLRQDALAALQEIDLKSPAKVAVK